MNTKKSDLIKEIFRYVISGGIATVCDILTKTLMHSFILPEDMGSFSIFGFVNELSVTISTVSGFFVGLIVNYIISIFFVFTAEGQKEKGKGVKAFLIYFAVSLVGLLINLGVTQLGCNLLSVTRDDTLLFMFVSGVAACVSLIWNYLGRKIFVYKGV